jgi:outer membrane protein TolC
MARGRYQAGVGNAIELGDAEVSAMTAQAQRVQAESTLGLARSTLRWHLGLLTPPST